MATGEQISTDVAWRPIDARIYEGRQQALVEWADGRREWRDVRVSIERTVLSEDGQVTASGEVASTDNGSVRCE